MLCILACSALQCALIKRPPEAPIVSNLEKAGVQGQEVQLMLKNGTIEEYLSEGTKLTPAGLADVRFPDVDLKTLRVKSKGANERVRAAVDWLLKHPGVDVVPGFEKSPPESGWNIYAYWPSKKHETS